MVDGGARGRKQTGEGRRGFGYEVRVFGGEKSDWDGGWKLED